MLNLGAGIVRGLAQSPTLRHVVDYPYLFDRLDFELFGITVVAHGSSQWGSFKAWRRHEPRKDSL